MPPAAESATRSGGLVSLVPALFVIGAICQYVGASIAVPMFDELNPAAVAWLRTLGAGGVLLAIWWPLAGWRWPRTGVSFGRRRLLIASAFGLVTLGMNVAFYLAIDHIDLGVAVAIEFLGPIVVAAAGSRRMADGMAVLAVLVGVVLLSGASLSGSPIGVVFALLAAAMWAGYILIGKVVSGNGTSTLPWRDGIDDLAIGLSMAGAICAPLVIGVTTTIDPGALWDWRILALGVAVGVLSSAIPYLLDQIVLVRLTRARFALLLALLPVTAAVVGAVMLSQIPSAAELCGMALVVAAIVFTARDGVAPDIRNDIAPGASTG
ncbi:DMT family transporter [Nocardia sp. 348MFTsu5.1]|uniref:EamA family transporter n=1 Tax=Nocardia sp. 348MFTsu5.1 TaxID=1172185 RepID=UPI000370C2CD|nr:EamA family transporter [Nocardia sp. 348MFTsu5.1]